MHQSPPHNLVLGSQGERKAADFLEHKNFHIIEMNYRTRYGEIDIIAQDKNELVFVEVRTRTSDEVLDPVESIDEKKIDHIRLAIYSYLNEKQYQNDFRIDIISILPHKIEHFENVTL